MTHTQANEPGFVLVPCPFCGSSSNELMLFCDPDEGIDNSGPSRRIQCAGCNVEAPFYSTKGEAVEAWNRRALSAPSVPSPAYGGVRALEWTGTEKNGRVEYWSASTGLHQDAVYEVWKQGDGIFKAVFDGVPVKSGCASPDEAKTAAQADHERSVLSCLSPVAVEEADAKAEEPFAIVANTVTDEGGWKETDVLELIAEGGDREFVGSVTVGDIRRAALSTPSPQIGKAGAGPVGEAVEGAMKTEGFVSKGGGAAFLWIGERRFGKDEVLAALAARPDPEAQDKVERLTRERDRATGLWRGASERAETAEAALAESEQNAQGLASDLAGTQAALAETRTALKAHHDWHLAQEESPDGVGGAEAYAESPLLSQTVAALTGDAQEANR